MIIITESNFLPSREGVGGVSASTEISALTGVLLLATPINTTNTTQNSGNCNGYDARLNTISANIPPAAPACLFFTPRN